MRIILAFFRLIIRPRVVIGLIILTLLAAALGSLIPQAGSVSPAALEEWRRRWPLALAITTALQLTHLYTSYWFLGLIAVISLALIYTLAQQIKRGRLLTEAVLSVNETPIPLPSGFIVPARIVAILAKRGYRLQNQAADRLLFSRFSLGRWGSAVFHLGLLIIVVAGFLALLLQQRGYVQVIEGDLFSGRSEDFLSQDLGVLQDRFDTGFPVFLGKLTPEYWENGKLKHLAAALVFPDPGRTEPETATLGVNRPVTHQGVRILQALDFGYTVSLMITRPDGSEIPAHFLLKHPFDPARPFVGGGNLPVPGYRVALQFYPDLAMRSLVLDRPILWLTLERLDKGIVHNGLVPPGGSVPLGEGALSFFRVSLWSGLIFVRSIDMTLAYAGFIVACLGAALMYLLPRRAVTVRLEEGRILMAGRCDRYRPLFVEELAEIVAELAKSPVGAALCGRPDPGKTSGQGDACVAPTPPTSKEDLKTP